MSEQKNEGGFNYAVAGRVRKARIKALKEVGATITDEMEVGWVLANMSEDEFQAYLAKEAEVTEGLKIAEQASSQTSASAEPLTPEQSEARIRDLEAKLEAFMNQNAPALDQNMVDLIVEKRLHELGLHGKPRDNEQDMKVFKDITKTLESVAERIESNQPSRPKVRIQVDPDDVLPEPIHFFAYRSEYFVHGDKRQGQDISTPYNASIKFKPSIRLIKSGSSRYDKSVISVCEAKILSRKEAEFLRSHTLYGIAFYENVGDAASVDIRLVDIMSSVSAEINAMTQHQVIQRASAAGLPMDKNIDLVKKKLIEQVAHQRLQAITNKKYDIHPTASMLVTENGKEMQIAIPEQ